MEKFEEKNVKSDSEMSETDEAETHSQESTSQEKSSTNEGIASETTSDKIKEKKSKNENIESEQSVDHKKKTVKRKRKTKTKDSSEKNSDEEESQKTESSKETVQSKDGSSKKGNDSDGNDETESQEEDSVSESSEEEEKPKKKAKRSKTTKKKSNSEGESKQSESNTEKSQSSKESAQKNKKRSLPKPPLVLSSRSDYEVHEENNGSEEIDDNKSSKSSEEPQNVDQESQDQNQGKAKVTKLDIPKKEDKTPVQQAYDDLVEHGKRPAMEYTRGVNRMLQQAAFEALENEDYDRAEKIEAARAKLGAGVEEEATEQSRQQKRAVLQQRLDTARDEYKKLEGEWKQVLQVFTDEQNGLKAQLEDRHSQELQEFEQRWENVENRAAFNKPSPQLLSLRRQQKVLALSKQFAAAKVVKMEADRLASVENMEAMKRAVATMQKELTIIEERQKKEMDYFEEHRWRTEVYITGERKNALHPVEMQIKQLEAALDETPMNKKPTTKVFTSTVRTRTIRAESAVPLLPRSPRTSRAYNQYRVSDEPTKLELGKINMRQYLKKRPGSVARMNRLISTK